MDLEYYPDDYTLLGLYGLKSRLNELIDQIETDIDEREQANEAALGKEVD